MSCEHDFVNFVATDELLHKTPGGCIGAVRLCRKCYALPPAEPEIVVTDEMLNAGACAFPTKVGPRHPDLWLADAYTAMRRLEKPVCKHEYHRYCTYDEMHRVEIERVCTKCGERRK